MKNRIVRVGTRGSQLALKQTGDVIARLRTLHPGIEIETAIIKTSGDADQESSLEKIGGFGLFTKKIEAELLSGTIDIAVHSAKDLPSVMTDGLAIGAVPPREDNRDAWLSGDGSGLNDIKPGALVGTGSPRRRAQILNLRPDLKTTDLRGNIDTRLRKLSDGVVDIILMAAAGLKRLELDDNITEYLPPESFIPAPGQGALVVQVRSDDDDIPKLTDPLSHDESRHCLIIERLLLEKLGAGCSAAVGGWARYEKNNIRLSAVVLDKNGRERLYKEACIEIGGDYSDLVEPVVSGLIDMGAQKLMAENE